MSETALKIKLLGEPILKKKAKTVEKITDAHRITLSEMARLMYDSSGIGLAAPQVGINEAMMVVDIGSGLYKLINPKIVKKEGYQAIEEGCLSVPGVFIKVKRAKKVMIKAQDENGEALNLKAEDLLACVFQHEIDHLKGKLIIDYASLWERLKIRNKIELLKRKIEDERMPESKTKSCKLQL